jgi:hypothetical protein
MRGTMNPRSLRRRFLTEASLTIATALLGVVTIFWRDWIEIVFRADPDHHSGALEWTIVVGLLSVAVASYARARVDLRKYRAAPR